jgi:hypothetical protein
VRSWLPGDAIIEKKIAVPETVPAGELRISAGIVRPGEVIPAVRFANEGADPGGWIPLGVIHTE